MTEHPPVGHPPYPGQAHPGVAVAWSEEDARLVVTTWGSSSNPTVPSGAQLVDGVLVLTLGRRAAGTGPMTADLAAHTTLIEPPAGLAPGAPARVRVGELEVALRPGHA